MIKALREALSCATAAAVRPAYSHSNTADARRKVVNFKQFPWVVPAGQSIESKILAASNLGRKPGICGSASKKKNGRACEMVAAAGPDSSESTDKCRQMRRCLSKNFLYPAATAGHKTPSSPHEWPTGPNAGRNRAEIPRIWPAAATAGHKTPGSPHEWPIGPNAGIARNTGKFPAFGLRPPWRTWTILVAEKALPAQMTYKPTTVW
jgi:hypothetical protein